MLAIVPSIALAALWAVTTGQTMFDFHRQAAQGLLAQKAGQPSNIVYYNLQEERRLTAEQLARPGSVSDQLINQRRLTDDAVRTFQTLSDVDSTGAPTEVRNAVDQARQAMTQLPAHRAAVDQGIADQQTTFTYYTDLITVDLQLFTALSHVENGEVTYVSRTLVASFWAKEMLAREDALLARGWPSGKLSSGDYQQVQQAISDQAFLYTTMVVPYLPANESAGWQRLTAGIPWQSKASVEQELMRPSTADGDGDVQLPPDEAQWRQAVDLVTPQVVSLLQSRTDSVIATGKDSVLSLLLKVVLTSVVGLLAVIAVIITSWRLVRTLRRRILALHDRAQELELTLPTVVERLSHGEHVDLEAERRVTVTDDVRRGGDELSRLGRALNLARDSALEAAVRQAQQHRGFERLLQRIARRTQLLIGLQLKKLDEMERRHEDPEVLQGLFDLDHLTARLRRYEENLVILAGGQPQRRWRKPVPLLDVLRAAQGEVQDYKRIMLDVEGDPWISERAVGSVVHVLAELMENAATFSKPPTPVEVRAALVGRGLAIEIEDRGLGMEPEQYDLANELIRNPPRMDVLEQADDVRLGLYVVARLADGLGLKVEFRASAFGGTRAVVLIPAELVTDGAERAPAETATSVEPVEPVALPARTRGRALAAGTVSTVPALPAAPAAEVAADPVGSESVSVVSVVSVEPEPVEAPLPRPSWAAARGEDHGHTAETPEPPLPQRIRQASLVAELRTPEPAAPASAPDHAPSAVPAGRPDGLPTRSGAAIGAFQRQSRAARVPGQSSGDTSPGLPLPGEPTPDPHTPTTEDRS
ncbi:sensor histidine kinase [Kitasatospora mediocidica]|uniref:sensor histidine kinase n=1 Tax=Kitasatospora mediocidica TaxID=58352 RepID=UPI000AC924BC|nr:nitrate- and nitrite sensing domain-containing protein [Kitasatospora mediocidica]